jgi:hypothetical protein
VLLVLRLVFLCEGVVVMRYCLDYCPIFAANEEHGSMVNHVICDTLDDVSFPFLC